MTKMIKELGLVEPTPADHFSHQVIPGKLLSSRACFRFT